VLQTQVFLAEEPLVLEVNGSAIGGTLDLVMVCGNTGGKLRLKLIDFKSDKLTSAMLSSFQSSPDCKLGYVSTKLCLYAYMLEQLFDNVLVEEAVTVFCANTGGFDNFVVHRPPKATVVGWLSADNSRSRVAARTAPHELKLVDFGDSPSRVEPFIVTGLPVKQGKGRPRQGTVPMLSGKTVDTAVLVDTCTTGWNADFGEEYDNHFWLADDAFSAFS